VLKKLSKLLLPRSYFVEKQFFEKTFFIFFQALSQTFSDFQQKVLEKACQKFFYLFRKHFEDIDFSFLPWFFVKIPPLSKNILTFWQNYFGKVGRAAFYAFG